MEISSQDRHDFKNLIVRIHNIFSFIENEDNQKQALVDMEKSLKDLCELWDSISKK